MPDPAVETSFALYHFLMVAPRGARISPDRSRSRHKVLAGTGILGLVTAAAIWHPFLESPFSPTQVLPNADPTPTAARTAQYTRAADNVLRGMGRAVMTRDRVAYLAAFDPRARKVRAAETQLFTNLRQVPLRSWDYQVVELRTPAGSGRPSSLGARVRLSYRLGTNPGVTSRDLDMTFVPGAGSRWQISRVVRVAGTVPDPWNFGPVKVVNTPRALVLGVGKRSALREYARQASLGAGRLDRIWGSRWPRQSVLVIPSDQRQLAQMLGQSDQAGLQQVAAVTTGLALDDKGATAGQAARMIVNPQAMAQLGRLGHQVIITHELTHLATWNTTTASPPMWLSEGFADYVAYSGTGLGAKAVTANSVALQGVQGITGLPDDEDFNPRTTSVDGAYAQSWLAADLIARRWSQAALVQFYQAVANPAGSRTAPVEAREADAFRAVLGTTPGAFTALWRSQLEKVVR